MSKKLTGPKGSAIYPRLNSPDTKYDPDGTYHIKVSYDSDLPEVQNFMAKIDAWHAEAIEEAAQGIIDAHKEKTDKVMKPAVAAKKVKDAGKPYTFVEDDDGEDTNIIVINYKMMAKAKNRKTGEEFNLKPAIFGAGKDPLVGKQIPGIYSGTELRVAYTPIKWFKAQLGASVRLRLEAVRIIKLVSGSGGNSDSYGFGDDDDGEGYVPPPAAETMPDSDDEATGGDDADDNDGDF